MTNDLIIGFIMGAIAGASGFALLQALTGYMDARRLARLIKRSPFIQHRHGQLRAATDNFKHECEKELSK